MENTFKNAFIKEITNIIAEDIRILGVKHLLTLLPSQIIYVCSKQ